MPLRYAVLFAAAAIVSGAGASERGSAARTVGPQQFQVQDSGLPGEASPDTPDRTKPYLMTFAIALARTLGIDLEIRNGRADLFTFHPLQGDTLAVTAGGGSRGTFLNLRWRLGQ